MFRFEHPEFFIAFAVVVGLLLSWIFRLWMLRRSEGKLATQTALTRLTRFLSRRRLYLREVSMLIAVSLVVVALTNPQWGTRRESIQAEAADIFIALDISNSMLAEDIAPNRLERARRFAQLFVERFRGDRIGLIVFAGNAYLQMPLTTDYASALLFVKSAHPGLAGTQGTSIGDAIELAMRAYEEDVAHQRALVIITDGENHEEGAIEAMQKGVAAGLVPFVVSVGTSEGALIPVEIDGRQDYKRDENGNPVRTSVNEEFLGQLARAGDGVLYSILGGDSVLDDMEKRMADLSKREMEQRAFTDFESYYQYFLLGGIVFLVLGMTIATRRKSNVRSPFK